MVRNLKKLRWLGQEAVELKFKLERGFSPQGLLSHPSIQLQHH